MRLCIRRLYDAAVKSTGPSKNLSVILEEERANKEEKSIPDNFNSKDEATEL